MESTPRIDLTQVLVKPIVETRYASFTRNRGTKHISAKLMILSNLFSNEVTYEVRYCTRVIKGKVDFTGIKQAVDYYNSL